MTMNVHELRALARVGVESQLQAAAAEVSRLQALLGELADGSPEAPVGAAQRRKGAARPHWTQTPVGKQRLAATMRKVWRTRRAKEGK